jgi:hypothetical protein
LEYRGFKLPTLNFAPAKAQKPNNNFQLELEERQTSTRMIARK